MRDYIDYIPVNLTVVMIIVITVFCELFRQQAPFPLNHIMHSITWAVVIIYGLIGYFIHEYLKRINDGRMAANKTFIETIDLVQEMHDKGTTLKSGEFNRALMTTLLVVFIIVASPFVITQSYAILMVFAVGTGLMFSGFDAIVKYLCSQIE